MAQAANGPDFGRAAEFERAGTDNIFSGWILLSRPLQFFSKLYRVALQFLQKRHNFLS